MKFMKWKILIITCVVCLLPIVLGIFLWDALPDNVAIHFDINNNPDNFASKTFSVFGLPLLMAALQIYCCFVNDINVYKYGERKKFEIVTKWIIPVMSLVLQASTLGYAMGFNVDIRRIATFIVAAVLVAIGNYLPKFDYVKNFDVDAEKARKINRFIGFETMAMGLLFAVSIFLPPLFTAVCLALLIPYAVIAVIFSLKIARKSHEKKSHEKNKKHLTR